MSPETCSACGKTITARAIANIFDDRIVCTRCWRTLNSVRTQNERREKAAQSAATPHQIRDPAIHVDATLPGPGDFAVGVVGESMYQEAIERAAGGRFEDGCEEVVDAVLVLEDSNPHDAKAVQVLIGGRVCGYLSRANARAYRKQLKKSGHPTITAACKAVIVGGWDRGPDDRGHFGIRLDLPHDA